MTSNEELSQDLHGIVAASGKDMTNMKANLAKLRALSEDDKTEAAMLRSRIDEQSQLIMILKRRADESGTSIVTLERINKELEDFRNQAQSEIDTQLRRYNMLDARFNDLASNHQELIKIKDEYKRVNEELRRENFKLRDDNSKLFSKAVEERDKKIADLDRKIRSMKDQAATMENRYKELQASTQAAQEKQNAEMKEIRQRLSDTEERLKGANAKIKHYSESQQSTEVSTSQKIQSLTKEKDDLLALAMSRGKLIQEKQTENKKLETRIQQMEKAVKDMDEKYEREAAAVNVNLQVRKLRADLSEADQSYKEVTREFDAFKKHSGNLLQKERDLNAKLRHLVG